MITNMLNETSLSISDYILVAISLAITSYAQLKIKSNYNKYKKVKARSGRTGAQVARQILDRHGLTNVKVESVEGDLTDHYDPKTKVVRLSNDIHSGASIASVSVAAHECGHAIQDKVGYGPMRLRSALVPVVNFSTKIGYYAIAIGIATSMLKIAIIGIILLLSMLVFQLVTLPVEFDASRRGKDELASLGILDSSEQKGSAKMLKAAAFTYVASVLSTSATMLRQAINIFSRRSRK